MFSAGDTFSHSFAVSAQVYNGFIETFRDRNPLHVDAEFARSKGFTREVVHGNVLNGFLSYFIGECLPVKNVVIHWQQIQYHKPLYVSDHLVLQTKVESIHEAVNSVIFKFKFLNIKNQTVAKGTFQIGIL